MTFIASHDETRPLRPERAIGRSVGKMEEGVKGSSTYVISAVSHTPPAWPGGQLRLLKDVINQDTHTTAFKHHKTIYT